MTYLICEQCGGYYELQEGEKVEDFSDECECGGKLRYAESLPYFEDLNDSESTEPTASDMDMDPDLDLDPQSVFIENQSKNLVEVDEKYQDETLIESKEILEKDQFPPRESELDKSELKEFKLAVELQEILEVKGNYIIQGSGPTEYIRVLRDGIEIDGGQFIGYSDIVTIQDEYNPKFPKSGIGGLISSVNSLISSKNWSFKIIYNEGELEFNGVKKSDAQRFVSFVNRIIKNREN